MFARSYGRSFERLLGRTVAQSYGDSIVRSLGHTFARAYIRSVVRSFGLTFARSLGGMVIRSLGRTESYRFVEFLIIFKVRILLKNSGAAKNFQISASKMDNLHVCN